MTTDPQPTPRQLGFYFPAEFSRHEATWLSWPHKEASWPGKIDSIFPIYSEFIKFVAAGELVKINVADEAMKKTATAHLHAAGVNLDQIRFFFHPTDDAWCRDHGPAFLVHRTDRKKMVVKWNYNAWGGKYPPFDLDNQVPLSIAKEAGLDVAKPGIVMEGGSVEFNGRGTVLTTTSCLLNPNRNPHLTQAQIERYLSDYYGADNILWLGDGIVGDDTDGHIDDITRFVSADTVVTVLEDDRRDANYAPLVENLENLERMKLENGQSLRIFTLPMPKPVVYQDQRLPASYANFYIANDCVVTPTFNDKNDDVALSILQKCFPDRKVIGLNSTDIIWGLGSFHCLSQQEPALTHA